MPNWLVGPFIHAFLLQMLTEPPQSAGRCVGREGYGGEAPAPREGGEAAETKQVGEMCQEENQRDGGRLLWKERRL